ncbi:MAG: hypothetical protein DSY89_07770, partial [Deltaproteobacteria bacterium]
IREGMSRAPNIELNNREMGHIFPYPMFLIGTGEPFAGMPGASPKTGTLWLSLLSFFSSHPTAYGSHDNDMLKRFQVFV